jgi:hypothetical protein
MADTREHEDTGTDTESDDSTRHGTKHGTDNDDNDGNRDDNRDNERDDDRHDSRSSRNGHRREPADAVRDPVAAVRAARDQLTALTGQTAEGVSSLARTEDGWALTIEVLELERVPDTMSLLASYEVALDTSGNLTGYRRVRRYERGRADRK